MTQRSGGWRRSSNGSSRSGSSAAKTPRWRSRAWRIASRARRSAGVRSTSRRWSPGVGTASVRLVAARKGSTLGQMKYGTASPSARKRSL